METSKSQPVHRKIDYHSVLMTKKNCYDHYIITISLFVATILQAGKIKKNYDFPNSLITCVGRTGIEPVTSCLSSNVLTPYTNITI